MHTACPITIHTYRQAAQVLGRAFVDDPVSVAAYPKFSAERRMWALTADFSTEVLLCVRKGCPLQVSDGDKLVAAAVVYPPGAYPLSIFDQWMILIKSVLGNGFYDIRTWLSWLKEVERNHPRQEHYYLEYLAVEPDFQGQGYGSTILKYLTGRADESGVGCYLENANPRNIPFYRRFGFDIVGETMIVGFPTWFMWRAPV